MLARGLVRVKKDLGGSVRVKKDLGGSVQIKKDLGGSVQNPGCASLILPHVMLVRIPNMANQPNH